MNGKFKEEDKTKVVQFLNMVASNAKFNMDTQELIKYYHLLSYMQKELLPKIEDNIAEVTRVIEENKEE